MKSTTAYITVKVNITHRDDITEDDAVETAMSEMEYNMAYDHDGIRIAGTEIIAGDFELEATPF